MNLVCIYNSFASETHTIFGELLDSGLLVLTKEAGPIGTKITS